MRFIDRHRGARRVRLVGRVALLLACGLLLLQSSACWQSFAPLPQPPAATPDPAFNSLFTRSDHGWTGGDGTLSIGLPDGRTLWLFGDSFLGHVRPDGSRPEDSPLIRNCLVIQDGQTLTTRHGGTDGDPTAFLVGPDRQTWYWPGDGTVWAGRVQIFFHRFRQAAPGMWGWVWDGTVIATLRLPGLTLERLAPAPDDSGVAYGSALLERGPWVYVFGTAQQGAIKYMHLARAPRQNLELPWQYWTGRHWSTDEGASQPILAGVDSQFGVLALADDFGLVTMDARTPFSDRVVLYLADAPTGPWRGPVEIYRAPEASQAVAAYNPFVHPQFGHATGYLISYNINHLHDPDQLYADAGLYRPRFIRADLDRLAAGMAAKVP
jgi:hypothetical protein